ncbi:hypothetical protein D9619_000294 [Psilocybe cf. subviscida]|uniref:Uncharacterized protein n=1 Tax=Psilocybe cf. subviscida TaxID=2480587 RepID=A0A8H5BGB1_9AGAR|nr:hypothetical protein D9619_000294 [Psilocybe cf. subviscida]
MARGKAEKRGRNISGLLNQPGNERVKRQKVSPVASEEDIAPESDPVPTSVPATMQQIARNSFFRSCFGVDCGLDSDNDNEDISFSDLEASEEESEPDSDVDEAADDDWEEDLELQRRLFDLATANGDDMNDEEWLPPDLRKKRR